MANLYKWVGQNVTFTFGSTSGPKAKNNSGISYVVLLPSAGASSSYNTLPIFDIAYAQTYSGGGTYYNQNGSGIHQGIYKIPASYWSLTNTAAGNTSASVMSVAVTYESTNGSEFRTGLFFNSSYANAPFIDNDDVNTIYSYTPATSLTINTSKSEFYNDDTTVTFTVVPTDGTTARRTLKTPVTNVTSNQTGIITSPGAGTTNVSYTLGIAKTTQIVKSTTVTLSATHAGGAASSTAKLSPSQISGSKQVTVKNAVASIQFVDTVKYISVGETDTISYSITPVATGQPYSYYAAATATTNSKFTYKATQAVGAGSNGIISITGASVGSGTITISTSYCATGAKSDSITIYITPADTSIYINTSDTYSLTVGTGVTITSTTDNGTSSAPYISVSITSGVLKIDALKATPSNTPVKITLAGGAVISVTVTNLDITIA